MATGREEIVSAMQDEIPAEMFPLVNRPFLQHVIEQFVERGVREFDVVLCHRPEIIEDFFGDGTRWGCTIRYHLTHDPSRPVKLLKWLLSGSNEKSFFYVRGDRLSCVPIDSGCIDPEHTKPTLVVSPSSSSEESCTLSSVSLVLTPLKTFAK